MNVAFTALGNFLDEVFKTNEDAANAIIDALIEGCIIM